MKNTAGKGRVTFLVFKTGDKYTGVCKEFGFVEEGSDGEEVSRRLVNAAVLLVDTVAKHPRLGPSLNTRPPFRYWILFFVLPVWSMLASLFQKFEGNIQLFTESITPAPVHG